jgi:hypothetical protein
LKQGGIRHALIIGKKLDELDDECWGCWGHKVLLEEGRGGQKKKNDEIFERVFE